MTDADIPAVRAESTGVGDETTAGVIDAD